jgi:hypothetical protein
MRYFAEVRKRKRKRKRKRNWRSERSQWEIPLGYLSN